MDELYPGQQWLLRSVSFPQVTVGMNGCHPSGGNPTE